MESVVDTLSHIPLAGAAIVRHFCAVETQLNRLTTALAAHYRIERELGAGGMATVYLAHDIKHDRDVAIKVLKPELASSIAAERFLREIGITARLSHPHVLPLLDSGAAGGGDILYFVMPVITGESLRDRLRRGGALPLDDALRLTIEVSEALAYAHAHGVVHRDVKPDNVMLSDGHAIVMDFGIAKAVGQSREESTLTMEGTSLGTPTYMSPEQAAGEGDIDHRADIYAVGAMLYEMVSGAPPFAGSWQQIVMEKLAKDAPLLSTRAPSAPASVTKLVARCLSRDAAVRPQSVDELLRELRALATPVASPKRSRVTIAVGVIAAAALAVSTFLYVRERRESWVLESAVPSIERMIDADQLDSAYDVVMEALKRNPTDTVVSKYFDFVSQSQTFLSEPEGAVVTRASLTDTTRWFPVGTTPTTPVRIPTTAWFYRYSKPGYRTVTIMGALLGGSYVPIPSPVPLRRVTDPDSDMVLLRGKQIAGTLYGLNSSDKYDLADFLMDAREVTNKQYRAFVDAGGYANRALWDSTITRDGNPMAWDAAMALFVDRTGRPGPASWEGGAPQRETEDLPVGGVSWYEARAYARFAKKELPTVYEWNAAAIPEAARWVVPTGRFESDGAVRGGDARAVSPRGVYDLAGNVREWTVNTRTPGSRYILGGGYSDPPYLFAEIYAQPEFDRSLINGIRLVRRVGDSKDLAAASAPIAGLSRDYATAKPVDDATYRGFLAMYDYDRTPLNVKVESRDSSAADWVREDITFDMPAVSTRMYAVLFTPKRARAPYQTIVLWPASDAFFLAEPKRLSLEFVDYFARSGRAVLHPIYEHTYGRGTSRIGDKPDGTIAHRDQVLRWVREMRRSIDYLTTRSDIDTSKLAFVGTSWGGRMSGVAMAVEPRFRTAVLNVPGLTMSPLRPEEDPVNFLPRVKMPVLMLSGKFDSVFPYELSQKPFYQLLGTPEDKKKHIVFDLGHFLPRPRMMQESLSWMDQYLGPVARP